MNNLKTKQTKEKGRGVFAGVNFEEGGIIERCPVLILGPQDRSAIDGTKLYNYYFSWGKDKEKAAIALGYGSLYNHSFEPNADYIKDLENGLILFKAIENINKKEEILVDYTQGGKKEDLWFDLI